MVLPSHLDLGVFEYFKFHTKQNEYTMKYVLANSHPRPASAKKAARKTKASAKSANKSAKKAEKKMIEEKIEQCEKIENDIMDLFNQTSDKKVREAIRVCTYMYDIVDAVVPAVERLAEENPIACGDTHGLTTALEKMQEFRVCITNQFRNIDEFADKAYEFVREVKGREMNMLYNEKEILQ